MPLSAVENAYLRVSQANRQQLGYYGEALHLTSTTGLTLTELQHRVCVDRLDLATHFLAAGDKLSRARPSQPRSAISRFYYGMYHAMRAVVYFAEGGDDHEKHLILPKKTPADFPSAALWQNSLKDARERRNEADYDPYPASQSHFFRVSRALQGDAHGLVTESRNYLKSKGCLFL